MAMIQDDPVIQRIREARAQFQAECDNDIHKMYLCLLEEQKKYADRLVHWEHPDEILDFVPATLVKPQAQNGT
jgi:hypothetical protein